MPNLNGLSSLSSSLPINNNLEIRPQAPLIQPKQIINNKTSSDGSLILTLSKIKNYMKRLGLALIGHEEKLEQNQNSLIGQIASPEDQDPLIGNWPSNFPPSFSPPKPQVNLNNSNSNQEQEFKQLMEEVEQQKAALDMVKDNEAGLNLT